MDFASTGPLPRSRFSTVTREANPAAACVNSVAGRACRPLGLRMTISAVRMPADYRRRIGS
jgi:hypothetical protein